MKHLTSFLISILIVFALHAESPYHDALVFDARGRISSIDYIPVSDLPTPLITFDETGAIAQIFQQQAFSDSLTIKLPLPISDIKREGVGCPVSINFKTLEPYNFSLNIDWTDGIATAFQYLLLLDTRYVKEYDGNGLTTKLKLFVYDPEKEGWIYGGETCYSDYSFDEQNNWITRKAKLFDENKNEIDSCTQKRIITYY